MLTVIYMAVMSRLSGNGFGQKWGVSWLPEVLFALPFGIFLAYATDVWWLVFTAIISYLAMQSATWTFLKWGSHEPNTERKSTLKPVVDFIAKRFGYKLGDEGYSWISASVKGFLIGLPVGGLPLMILWPLGYEIGSHAKGRVEKYGIDPHAVSEVCAGIGAGVAIVLFLTIVDLFK